MKKPAKSVQKVKKVKGTKVGKASSTAAKKVKRPLTGYQLFAKEARAKIVEKNPQTPFGHINQIIGQLWRECQPKDKEKYLKMAEEEKQKLGVPTKTQPAMSGDSEQAKQSPHSEMDSEDS